MLKNIIVVSIMCLLLHPAIAQVRKGLEYHEIYKVAEINRQLPNLQFSVTYQYADDATPATVLEEMNGTYQFQQGKYKVELGDMVRLQGNAYSLGIVSSDSVITIGEMTPSRELLQLPLMDSIFRVLSVDSMAVSAVNDTTNRLRIYFKPGSYYAGYEMDYNKHWYRVYKIIYKLRENASDDDNPNPSGMARVTMTFGNYSTAPIDPEIFNEGNYVYKTGDTFYTRPQYAGFRLVVNVGK